MCLNTYNCHTACVTLSVISTIVTQLVLHVMFVYCFAKHCFVTIGQPLVFFVVLIFEPVLFASNYHRSFSSLSGKAGSPYLFARLCKIKHSIITDDNLSTLTRSVLPKQ